MEENTLDANPPSETFEIQTEITFSESTNSDDLSLQNQASEILEAMEKLENSKAIESQKSSDLVPPASSQDTTIDESLSDFMLSQTSDKEDNVSETENGNRTSSPSEEAVTQLFVHRSSAQDSDDVPIGSRECSDSIPNLPNDDSDDVISELSNHFSPSSDQDLQTLRPASPEPTMQNGLDSQNHLEYTSDGLSEMIDSSQSRLDLIWDTDIPSETEIRLPNMDSNPRIKEKSQHSCEGSASADSGNCKQTSNPEQQASEYSSEVESLTIFNKTELNPLPKRPVNTFGGTFKEGHGDDSLVETTWDSESLASQKDIQNDMDSEVGSTSLPPETTPVNEVENSAVPLFKKPISNPDSKLQISISTDVMDCTINADNLPPKKRGNTSETKRLEDLKASPAKEISSKVPKPQVSVRKSPVSSSREKIGQKPNQDNEKNVWVTGLRSNLYSKEPGKKRESSKQQKKVESLKRNEDVTASMKDHVAKSCSHHDHHELHVCCMPPAPSYNFTPRIAQVKKEVTQRSMSVDGRSQSSKKKYPVTATRRRTPSNASSTTEDFNSSVFEPTSSVRSTRFGDYRQYHRARENSLSRDYPSDTESVASSCNSRIPRYVGRNSISRSSTGHLSDIDVQQIVKLVKSGDTGGGNSGHNTEIVIKKDPVSMKWELASNASSSEGFVRSGSDSSRSNDKISVKRMNFRPVEEFGVNRVETSPLSSTRAPKFKTTQEKKILNHWSVGFFLGLAVAGTVRYVIYPALNLALEPGKEEDSAQGFFH